MTVHIKFFAGLRQLLPDDRVPYPADFPEGSTVDDALRRFEVPADKPKILLVNGRHATPQQILVEGDTLSVFPPVAGG
jgi:molybdopterin converting factor small subunit